MIAVYVNMITVLFGSLIGIVFGRKIKDSYIKTIMTSLGIIVGIIGISSAIVSKDTLCLVICLIIGSIIGEAIKLDDSIYAVGCFIYRKSLALHNLIGCHNSVYILHLGKSTYANAIALQTSLMDEANSNSIGSCIIASHKTGDVVVTLEYVSY